VTQGYFPAEAITTLKQRLCDLLHEFGVPLAGFYYCPHHPVGSVER
jgi:histidinol phosphatase-like enzyme